MHAAVAFFGAELIPGIVGREDEGVGPIGIVGNEATAGGAPDERTEGGPRRDICVTLRIAEGRRGFGPGIKAEEGGANGCGLFEQGLVEGHVP